MIKEESCGDEFSNRRSKYIAVVHGSFSRIRQVAPACITVVPSARTSLLTQTALRWIHPFLQGLPVSPTYRHVQTPAMRPKSLNAYPR